MTSTNSGKLPVPVTQPHQAQLQLAGHGTPAAAPCGNCHIFSPKGRPALASAGRGEAEKLVGVCWKGSSAPRPYREAWREGGQPAPRRSQGGRPAARAFPRGRLWQQGGRPQPLEPPGPEGSWGALPGDPKGPHSPEGRPREGPAAARPCPAEGGHGDPWGGPIRAAGALPGRCPGRAPR